MIPLLDLTRQFRSLKKELTGAVVSVMERGNFILGPQVARFEEEFARFCGVKYAVGVASGTDALELALRALEIGPGDRVITVSFTFLSTAEAIRKVGAVPIFVDIDPVTYTLDPSHLEATLKRLPASERRRIKAILPVHLYGHPCDMGAILRIARSRGWWVVEDCAQAHGATWNSRRVGSFGRIGCFSFFPSKNLGAYGDGGMLVTDSARLNRRLRILRVQGRVGRERQVMEGRNSRLDELQAAILRVKLRRLNRWTAHRRRVASWYTKQLQPLGLKIPTQRTGSRHVYHLYVVDVPRRDALQSALKRQGIAAAVHYRIPIHRQPLYRAAPGHSRLPVTERLSRRLLALPLFPEMTRQEIKRVVRAVARFYARSSGRSSPRSLRKR